MIRRSLFAISTAYILSINCCFAQAQGFTFSEEGPINIGTTLSFQSEVLSEERKILVSLPKDYHTSTKRYPVIYMLDAQYFFQFQYAYGEINVLEFMEEIPEVILVGIHSEDREKDMATKSTLNNRGGNADEFIEFLRSELQVFIEQQYRTQPYKILFGHSAGGFFALHTLVHAPDTFNGYIAIDPSLWWEDGQLIEDLENVLARDIEFNNTLFTSTTDENGEDYNAFIKLINESRPAGLAFSHMYFPDEDHRSIIMPGMHNGILSMYENWTPPDSINSLDALISHYQSLSAHYGYTVDIPVTHASGLGFKLANNGDPEGALAVFEYRLANISQDAIAYYSVGFALRSLGRLTEALAAFEKAIELGAGTDMFTAFVRFRDEVAQEINEQERIIE